MTGKRHKFWSVTHRRNANLNKKQHILIERMTNLILLDWKLLSLQQAYPACAFLVVTFKLRITPINPSTSLFSSCLKLTHPLLGFSSSHTFCGLSCDTSFIILLNPSEWVLTEWICNVKINDVRTHARNSFIQSVPWQLFYRIYQANCSFERRIKGLQVKTGAYLIFSSAPRVM